jgi:hypothetical protein
LLFKSHGHGSSCVFIVVCDMVLCWLYFHPQEWFVLLCLVIFSPGGVLFGFVVT